MQVVLQMGAGNYSCHLTAIRQSLISNKEIQIYEACLRTSLQNEFLTACTTFPATVYDLDLCRGTFSPTLIFKDVTRDGINLFERYSY
jgi:hypothetical protein